MGWRDVLRVEIRGLGINVEVGLLALMVLGVIAVFLVLFARRGRSWKVRKVNFRFAGIGEMEISPDNEAAQIAHTAWVELRSRKATIPFDPDHDVIVEIYDSWYQLFKALRDLAKNVPVTALEKGESAPKLAEVLLTALNDGLRPHLTRWQASFRLWYGRKLLDPSVAEMSPQEIQRLFPEYDLLISDLIRVTNGLNDFTEELRKIAHDRHRVSFVPFARS